MANSPTPPSHASPRKRPSFTQHHNTTLAVYVSSHEVLVNHIGQETLDLVPIQRLLAAKADGSRELGHRNSCPAHRYTAGLLRLIKAASDEHLTQQVAQGYVATSFERQVNSPPDELLLSILEGQIESVQFAFLDASRERQEQFLQVGVGLQQLLAGERMGREEMTWDQVGENQSVVGS